MYYINKLNKKEMSTEDPFHSLKSEIEAAIQEAASAHGWTSRLVIFCIFSFPNSHPKLRALHIGKLRMPSPEYNGMSTWLKNQSKGYDCAEEISVDNKVREFYLFLVPGLPQIRKDLVFQTKRYKAEKKLFRIGRNKWILSDQI